MRVSGWVVAAVLLFPLGASGQGVTGTGGDELPSRLLAALEALEVPADVWVALSPESAERLIAESAAADGDWRAAVARAGCEVTGTPPLRAIGEKWSFPTYVNGEGDRARALAEVLLGVPEPLRARLCAGAWIPSAPLTERARKALGALCEHDQRALSPDAPDAVVSLDVFLDYATASGATPDEERSESVGLGLSTAGPDPFVALTPESRLGLTVCHFLAFEAMSGAPAEYPYPTRGLCPSPPWGPESPLAALPLPATAVASLTGRVALRLEDWTGVVGESAGGAETVVDERYARHLVVVPTPERTGREVGTVVLTALGLGARTVGATRFVGEPDPRRSAEPGAEADWDGYDELVDWAVDLVRHSFRLIAATDLPEGDLAVLFGSELGPLSPGTAARLGVLRTWGPSGMPEADGMPPMAGDEAGMLVGRGLLYVGVRLGRVSAYGTSATAEAQCRRFLTWAGLPQDTPVYAVAGGERVCGPVLVVDPSRLRLGSETAGGNGLAP